MLSERYLRMGESMASSLARRQEADWPSVLIWYFHLACASMGTGATWEENGGARRGKNQRLDTHANHKCLTCATTGMRGDLGAGWGPGGGGKGRRHARRLAPACGWGVQVRGAAHRRTPLQAEQRRLPMAPTSRA